MSTKSRSNQFDCYDKIGPDEPFFILRAQDAEAADLVELWALRAKAAGCPLDKINEALATCEEMRRWPKRKCPD